jgi:hypothetical protein
LARFVPTELKLAAQEWLPVLVAPFVALMSRSNQLQRAVSRALPEHPQQALFVRSLLRRQSLALKQIRMQ